MNPILSFAIVVAACLCCGCTQPSAVESASSERTKSPSALNSDPRFSQDLSARTKIRVATYNASLHRKQLGELVQDLSDPNNAQAKKIAEIIQRIRPDILLINEIDYQEDGAPARLLRDNYLAIGQNGLQPMEYRYIYAPATNTGVPSEMDLDNDGNSTGPNDCFGFGIYPGQYALAVYSRFPIGDGRCFQTFLWSDMPGAVKPQAPDSESPFYPPEVWQELRLSSKNHCDVPIQIPGNQVLHFLVSHPTPPVFDGAEDRNGARNHDEIRFWTDYISPSDVNGYLVDDRGGRGGLEADSLFVIAGDLNSDPLDGDSRQIAIQTLLNHPRVQDPLPASQGGVAASERNQRTAAQTGDPQYDTSRWSSGNYRVDYVLPSSSLTVIGAGVFWPLSDDPTHELISASDHRLVWVDVQP